jgi:molybdopterin/thiamine biosynthesis adenylyltransferase
MMLFSTTTAMGARQMLSKRELARYGRQILIPEWAKAGQQKLKKAKVVVAGAGGLG